MDIPVMAELAGRGESPEILFWVGCSGSYDQRAQKITRAFAGILNTDRNSLCHFRQGGNVYRRSGQAGGQ